MKEDFLHHIWKFKKISPISLKTTNGEQLEIINFGTYTQKQGPDFFNAQIILNQQKWAGNIEIHVKSSDWYLHQHEKDSNYENVILHVVWEHDAPIFLQNNQEVPVLELKNYISNDEVTKYENLLRPKNWINCESQIHTVDNFVIDNWKERLFLERLEQKVIPILDLASKLNFDWEAVLFLQLAKNFGLNTNGDLFYNAFLKVSFLTIRKQFFDLQSLEALLFGIVNLLPENPDDTYSKTLVSQYNYLKTKYNLEPFSFEAPQFFKHRPDNFPTIRMAQLATLYHKHINLFSKIITTTSLQDYYNIFTVEPSEYWKNHYNFCKESRLKRKKTASSFIDLLLINTIIPVQFAYAKSIGKDIDDNQLLILKHLNSEKNSIIDAFKKYNLMVNNAFDSQALLQLKKSYCDKKKCLECGIGLFLLKK